jgi:hypothetical protein
MMKQEMHEVELEQYFFLAVLGFELRVYNLSYSTSPFFVMGVFKIGSCELFAQAGFKL